MNSWLMTYYLENEKKIGICEHTFGFLVHSVTVASFVSHSQINNNKSKCAKILYFHRPSGQNELPPWMTLENEYKEQRVYWRLSSLPWSKKSSKAIWLTDLWQYRAIIPPNVLFTFVMGLYTMGPMLFKSRIFLLLLFNKNFHFLQKKLQNLLKSDWLRLT